MEIMELSPLLDHILIIPNSQIVIKILPCVQKSSSGVFTLDNTEENTLPVPSFL
jgi:hypothetical protein